jgi:PKHD-type hydroxylase
MFLVIDNILTSEDVDILVTKLETANFVDGKTTAGWYAKLVKNNYQLDRNHPFTQELNQIVRNALLKNALFQAAIQPRSIHNLLFSCYERGMSYDNHVDNSLMGGNNFQRSDVSFTIFLNNPSDYAGGELVIEGASDDSRYKLKAGSAIVYPSSSIHRVEKVTEGKRLVVVGWVQCLVRDASKREILFDLDTVRRSIFAKEGKTIEFDLLSKSYSNLLRRWVD